MQVHGPGASSTSTPRTPSKKANKSSVPAADDAEGLGSGSDNDVKPMLSPRPTAATGKRRGRPPGAAIKHETPDDDAPHSPHSPFGTGSGHAGDPISLSDAADHGPVSFTTSSSGRVRSGTGGTSSGGNGNAFSALTPPDTPGQSFSAQAARAGGSGLNGVGRAAAALGGYAAAAAVGGGRPGVGRGVLDGRVQKRKRASPTRQEKYEDKGEGESEDLPDRIRAYFG